MPDSFSLPQQFFAISSPLPGSRVLLAGGLDPISGQRSDFQASVVCYDYALGSVVWQVDVAKNYPFRAITRTDGACAAIVPQNFARHPIGMFRFDIKSGDAIAPDSAVSGWKVQYVDAGADAFFFSWVDKETSFMRAVGARGGAVRERSFPYHSTGGGKTIERVFAPGEDTFIAFFSLVDGKRVAFSIESWTLDSTAPAWEARTLRNVIRNGEVLVGWENTGKKLEIQIFSAESGHQETSFRVKVPNVVCIQPIDANTYAILSISGVYVMRADTRSITQLPGMSSSDFLDFGSIAVDASAGKLLVATAGNYERPGTRLMLLDL